MLRFVGEEFVVWAYCAARRDGGARVGSLAVFLGFAGLFGDAGAAWLRLHDAVLVSRQRSRREYWEGYRSSPGASRGVLELAGLAPVCSWLYVLSAGLETHGGLVGVLPQRKGLLPRSESPVHPLHMLRGRH